MDPLEPIKTQTWSLPKIIGSTLIKYTRVCVQVPTEGQVEKSIHERAGKRCCTGFSGLWSKTLTIMEEASGGQTPSPEGTDSMRRDDVGA